METVTAAAWIDAPPRAVWAVLTDLDRYPEWNPLYPEAAGDLAVGRRVTQRGAFCGFMVRFSGRALDRAEAGFRALNGALKARVETG